MIRALRNGFISGLVLVAPLGVTLFVLSLLMDNIGKPAGRMIFGPIFNVDFDRGIYAYLLGTASIIIVVFLITFVGLLSKLFVARFFVNAGEQALTRVPFVSTIYKSVKQIVDTFAQQQKAIFQKTVLIEYPRKGVYAIGFLTSNAKGEVQEKTERPLLNVFVPTTPNPTSGFLLMLPKEDVTFLDMPVGDGMKLIISGGAVVPPSPAEKIAEPETEKPAELTH
ncbi:MAG: DUF502 domain-containing protein [Verrucomicrobiota bacterium]